MAKITVRQLPRDPGPAAWNELLPDPGPVTSLEGKQTADWVVVGAGFAGLAAARRLAQLAPQDRIVVLEARRVADGPGGRNSGFMIDLPHDLASSGYSGGVQKDRLLIEDNRAAIGFAADVAQACDMPAEAFVRSGKINAAATEKGLANNRAYAAHLATLSEDHQILNADAMHKLTGTTYYKGGLFTPGAAMIQPAMFLRGAAQGLRSNRVQLYEHSPVTSMQKSGTWTLTTPQGEVSAPRVILAVNGHINSFGFAQGRLLHVFTYASMTQPLTADEIKRLGGARVWGVTPSDPMGTTVRRISGVGGDRLIIRNQFTCDRSMEVDDARLHRVGRDHDRAFAVRFPMLQGVDMACRWGGRLCLSRNDVSLVGELEPGLYSACVQNGLGTARGTLSGMLAAELAAGVSSARLSRALAQPQPTRLPPEPFAALGANASIRWQQMRAGREL